MPSIIFTEEFCQPENLYPFTLTRQIQDIRIGILTIREKWEKALNWPSFDKFEDDYKDQDRAIRVNQAMPEDLYYLVQGNLLPSAALVKAVRALKPGEFISVNENALVFCFAPANINEQNQVTVNKAVTFTGHIDLLHFPWDILQLHQKAFLYDFSLLTKGKKTEKASKTNSITKPSQVFLEKNVEMEHCIINASEGPVYIGKNTLVMEGSIIRGPVAIGQNCVVKMGARIYPCTGIGPGSVVGGEIKNAVLLGHSNKAHDGYLGDAVIGEWCNLGAGTSNSNIKNTAGQVRVWTAKGYLPVGQKCGFFMGDYSKTAINTAINTGTIIGACCNVFGNGLTPKYIPSFSWGSEGIKRYELDKALTEISNWKKMKGKDLSVNERSILHYIFEHY